MTTLFHVTRSEAAATILRDGFRDRVGKYMTDWVLCGVWLSDRPLDGNEGTNGDTVLAINFEVELTALGDYEVIEEGKPYRSGAFHPR